MATLQQNNYAIAEFIKTNTIVKAQHAFQMKFSIACPIVTVRAFNMDGTVSKEKGCCEKRVQEKYTYF